MRSHRRVFGAVLLVLGLVSEGMQAQATPKPVPLVHYHNAQTGVSLEYPLAWKPYDGLDYFGSYLEQDGRKPQLAVTFAPQGNYYAHTTLGDLTFIYFATPAASLEACRRKGDITAWFGESAQSETVIHGVRYARRKGCDAGMMKTMSAQVYFTWRNGTCHLFEEDFRTFAPGVVDGTRDLTDAERKALERHLDGIMQSVRFDGR